MSVSNNTSTPIKLTNVDMRFIGHTKNIRINVGVIPNKKKFDIILGMDVISYCNIELKSTTTGFDFSIESPICK